MWTAEDFLEFNEPEPGQPPSKLAWFVKQGGVLPEALAIASNELECRTPNHVAAFFQLPFPVLLNDEWVTVPGTPDVKRLQLRFLGCKIEFDDFGRLEMRSADPTKNSPGTYVSQGILLVPVWGARANHHHRYLEHADTDDRHNPVIVPQGPSWIDNRPIFKGPYASNFAGRLIREVKAALSHFLPAYGIVSLSASFVPEQVMGYCAMISPGRVTFAGDFVSCLKGVIEHQANFDGCDPADVNRIEEAVKFGRRTLGDFENQVLAMEKLRRSGESALALVGACSLLEWLIKQHIASCGGTVPNNFKKLIDHELMNLIDAQERAFLHGIREARNLIAHEAPPERHSYSKPSNQAGKQIEGVKATIGPSDVRKLLVLVFELYRRHNLWRPNSRSNAGV